MRENLWFMGASGTGLQEKARQTLAPTAPKSEGEIADAIEAARGTQVKIGPQEI